MLRHRPITTSLFAVLAGAALSALVYAGRDEPREIVAHPDAWSDESALAFARAGVPVPRTVLSGEGEEELDLAWIRRAFGYAKALTPKELSALEGGARRQNQSRGGAAGGGGGGGASGSEPSAPRESGSSRNDDFGARPGQQPAPAPTAGRRGERMRRAAGPTDSAGEADEAKEMELEEGMSQVDPPSLALDARKKSKAGKKGGGEVPRAALSKIKVAPRIGKVLFHGPSGTMESLVPRGMRVVTFVEGPRARTTVDLVFENPHDRRLQGTFYYPLPDGASPAAFGMFPGTRRVTDPALLAKSPLIPPLPASGLNLGSLQTLAPQKAAPTTGLDPHFVQDWKPMQLARVVEQKRAREVYEQVVRSKVDPALMEWSGANTFKARVFPIEGKSLKRLVLTFEQSLPREGDHLRYVFPLPADDRLGEVEMLVHVKDAASLRLDLPQSEGSLRAPTGKPVAADDWKRFRYLAPKGYQGALDLAFKAPGAQVLTGDVPGVDGQAIFARLQPKVPDRESSAGTGRALFLLDTSLSEEGVRRALAGEMLLKVLEKDPTITDYAVLLFDVRPRWLHAKAYRKNTPEARAQTAIELGKVYLEGATHFAGVLDEVEREAKWIDGEQPATRFLLSDGLITWGNDKVEALLAGHPSALKGRWLTYRFGDVAVNGALFAALSRESSGQTVNVLSAEQIDKSALAHRKAAVKLKAVRIPGARDLVVAGDPKLLFPGQTLEIGARWLGKQTGEIQVVLEVDGQEVVERTPVKAGSSLLAGRAWAELWTGKLLALDDERLDRMVVALSQAFGLANKAASLLILEGEADWKRFKLEDEQVDMTNLERLRAVEEDQRRDRLQGIQMDKVSRAGRDLVRALQALKTGAFQPALPLLDRPLAGGAERIQEEVGYRVARKKNVLDVKAYDRVARARALAGDTMGAVRALSSLVEKRPRSAEANRLVGYACMALGQYGPAAELFERVRLNRPFEPQSFLEEALALEALGRYAEAARNYEIVLAREFPRHLSEVRVVAGYHYARLLGGLVREGGLEGDAKAQVLARQASLKAVTDQQARTALQFSIHWNTDSTDIDLWVVEPEGEKCFYSNKQTKAGGKLGWDTTTGYGPELYRRQSKPVDGKASDVLIHYYGNSSARWTVPTAVLYVRDIDVFGPEDAYTRRFSMRILPKSQAVLRLAKELP